MDRTRQRQLQKWLKQAQQPIQTWLWLNLGLGIAAVLTILVQMYALARLLEQIIVAHRVPSLFDPLMLLLLGAFALRAGLIFCRERVGFLTGQRLRAHFRQQILAKLSQIGVIAIEQLPAGSWATLLLEQVENLHNFYARYLPQQRLALLAPVLVTAAIFPLNWAAGLILLATFPLLPIFMALVGLKAAEANQQNIGTLSRLSGQFLDSLQGLDTLKAFHQAEAQSARLYQRTEAFRQSTMRVLKLAFLSSAVLEFFTSISIAIMAVYFGFSYLNEIDFGHYDAPISLFIGFFCLMLAPEFYQPMRELGVFYHDKAAALASADAIERFLTQLQPTQSHGNTVLRGGFKQICARELVALSPEGKALTQPLNFTIQAGDQIALIGQSGAGKSSLMNVLLGFLPYQGSVQIDGVELREVQRASWYQQIAWLGQNPQLMQGTIRSNLLLAKPDASDLELQRALEQAQAWEFVVQLGLEKAVADNNAGLSGGQAQRIAIARMILRDAPFLLLDEPTASLDSRSEHAVLSALRTLSAGKTSLMITHQRNELQQASQIWLMENGQIVQQGTFERLQRGGFL